MALIDLVATHRLVLVLVVISVAVVSHAEATHGEEKDGAYQVGQHLQIDVGVQRNKVHTSARFGGGWERRCRARRRRTRMRRPTEPPTPAMSVSTEVASNLSRSL